MPKYLTKSKFKAWLADRPANESVGFREEPDTCPIACYIKDTQEFPTVHVNPDILVHFGKDDNKVRGVEVSLPGWARQFISKVDVQPLDVDDVDKVEAQEALKILEAV